MVNVLENLKFNKEMAGFRIGWQYLPSEVILMPSTSV
jgi:amino acid transporter